MPNDEVIAALDAADQALTNLDVEGEAVESSIAAARSSINAARAILRESDDGAIDTSI